jgi:hypothetical protein
MASLVVGSGSVSVKWTRAPWLGSASTLVAIRFIIDTASQGNWPEALSAESMIASAPS